MSGSRIRYGGIVAGDEEIAAVTSVLRTQNWAAGEVCAEFEREFARWQGRQHALFVNSGSSALLLALSALPAGATVIMPALQFPTLYAAAHWLRLKVVLADVDDSLNLDPGEVDRLAAKADAVAFVHMAGNPAGVADVAELCGTYSLPLIEDACEAMGSVSRGVKAGNFGLAAAFSTHAAHHISTGEGGLVVTDDGAAFARMRRLRDWGRAYGAAKIPGMDYYGGYTYSELGLNLHASDIQAALGLVQLGRLEGFIKARQANWEALRRGVAGLPLTLPRTSIEDDPSWYTFAFLAPQRDKLAAHLDAAGIESRPIVAGNLARQPLSVPDGDFPAADAVLTRGLWISVHPAAGDDGITRVIAALRSFFDA